MESIKRKPPESNTDLKRRKIKTKFTIEQDFINYMSVPSLESIAILNVAAGLCPISDIKDSTFCGYVDNPVIFNEIEQKMLNKVNLLPLPNLLKDKVSDVVRPIILQVLKWLEFCPKDEEYEYKISPYWSSLGTIDKEKTLKQRIHPDKFINSIYKSACIYCLEDNIPNLWAKLPEKIQNNYGCSDYIYRDYRHHLIAYWTSIVTNQLPGFIRKIKPSDHKDIYNCSHSVNKNMFTLALLECNNLAVKYFWNKLTAEEISSNLARWVNDVVQRIKDNETDYENTNENADVLLFLLSQMNDAKQQNEVFRKNSSVILNSLFFNWPWQRFLLPTIRAMWNFLDEKVYVNFVIEMLCNIQNKTAVQLLKKVLWETPKHLKKCLIQYIVTESPTSELLGKLFQIKGLETITMILNEADLEEKKTIVFSVIKDRGLFEIIHPDKLPLFKKLIAETISQDSEIQELKKRIVVNHGKDLCFKWILANNWQKIETFFNWVFTSQEHIDYFKKNILDKSRITYNLLHKGNYELLNQFINWYFVSKQESEQFKEDFARSNPNSIIELGYHCDFCSFKKTIAWCLGSEHKINQFKLDILYSIDISDIIFRCITVGPYAFIDELISWCSSSNEEMKQFKAGFVLSEKGMALLQRCVGTYERLQPHNNLQLTGKFITLFSPLEKEIMMQLKEKISKSIKFPDYDDLTRNCFRMDQDQFFRFLENPV